MTDHGRTARILTAIDSGLCSPQQISRALGMPNASIRQSLFRLRRLGRVDRSSDGNWKTLPNPDSHQILDVLGLIESDQRAWSTSEIATCSDLTVGQVIAIVDVLARRGLIERISTTRYSAIDPNAFDQP